MLLLINLPYITIVHTKYFCSYKSLTLCFKPTVKIVKIFYVTVLREM